MKKEKLVVENLYFTYANEDGTMDLEFQFDDKKVFVRNVKIEDEVEVDEFYWDDAERVKRAIEDADESDMEEIKMKKVLSQANELLQFDYELPEVEVGDVVTLSDVWDGEGSIPEDGYSYLLTHNGIDGSSNYDVWIDYQFKYLKDGEHNLESEIEITGLELL